MPRSEGRDDGMSFEGAVPDVYERYLVPLLFRPYAEELARRLALRRPRDVIETAAGTGALTRELAAVLAQDASVTATDLSGAMLDRARAVPLARPVRWVEADAMALPFPDGSCDAVVCQFGYMFFPDRPRAFGEALRVLRPGGVLLLSVWDDIAANDFPAMAEAAVGGLFPGDPPDFLSRVPYGYHDPAAIARDVADGGFTSAPRIETLAARSRADSPEDAATALCGGTPLRDEIEARGTHTLDEAIRTAAAAIATRFGTGPVEGALSALVVTVTR
ncbi:methyltransferase family protein [Streptomyces sp. 1114.5]|uniref:class I SAM-dependent methyltransferase n=1 Tax=Streptomyces sp. 1114.5 TaxID=1938830 RepID=UPI000F27DB5B|nr:class I SAM-dependent methyltransferase [Streptomyces sp. 1114.5]RKT09780.1 methyltransferase family protein [Streptomyces sp. 1114.5]